MENIKHIILLAEITNFGSTFVNKKITNCILFNAHKTKAALEFQRLSRLLYSYLAASYISEDEFSAAYTELNALNERLKASSKIASIFPAIKLPKKNKALQRKLAFGQYSQLLKNITPSVRAVMRVIEIETIKHGVCTLSVKHIGDLSGYCRSTVQLALRILRKAAPGNSALIEVGFRPVKKGPHQTNVIRIICPVWIDLIKALAEPETALNDLYGFLANMRGLKKLSSMLSLKYITAAFYREMAKSLPVLALADRSRSS
ncbi:hypothetical protein OIV19_18345 [Brucella sp. HL-2]|nr:hypothetical protein [Brucella sp. HL-2]MCV9909564.1 hypothetical protein [Brucella sp. HL-2]